MVEEEKIIIKPEIDRKFHNYVKELYEVLTAEELIPDYRRNKAAQLLVQLETDIPIPEYSWTDRVPNNLMFLLVDRLYYYHVSAAPLLNRGAFNLTYYTETLIEEIRQRPYLDFLALIPAGEFPDQGHTYAAYTLAYDEHYELARQVISQMQDYRLRARCLFKIAENLLEHQHQFEVESMVYDIILTGRQAETHLERTMSLVEATTIMTQCQPGLAKILLAQALPEVLNIKNDRWNREELLVTLAENYAKIGDREQIEKLIAYLTDPYFVAQGYIAMLDYGFRFKAKKITQPVLKEIRRQLRRIEPYFREQIMEKTMASFINHRKYSEVFAYLPQFTHDATELAAAYVTVANMVDHNFTRLGLIHHALKYGTPTETVCVQIIEFYAQEGLFELARPVLSRLTDPYYLCQAYCRMSRWHFDHSNNNEDRISYIISAKEQVELVPEPRKRWELLIELIETHYAVGELPPVWQLVEQAVNEFNLFPEDEEWRGLLNRFVPLVTRIREMKWSFKLATSIVNEEYRTYFVNRVVESVEVQDITPDVMKQFWSYVHR
jgi:hypothetical protein